MSKVFDTVLAMRWAILPEALEQIFKVLERDFDPEKLAQAMHGEAEALKYIGENKVFVPHSIESVAGDPLPNARNVSVRDGVAILPIIGPIFPRANLFTMLSGGVSINQLALDFNAALRSEQVHTIIFNIDSPGGEITGVSEFADMVFRAGKSVEENERKPIITYVSGMMASAAYWIGSAADEIIINTTSELGSIGVVAGYTDRSKYDEKQGVKRIEVISSQSPKKRASPVTDEGRTEIQRVVDSLASVFVKEVADHRGVEPDDVLNNFGKGGLLIGKDAITNEMADETGSLESVIQLAIEQNDNSTFNQRSSFMNAKEKPVEFTMSYEAVRESAPDVFSQIRSEGIEEGMKLERTRIQGIESLKAPGFEAMIAENKFKPESTKESVAALILEAQDDKRKKVAEAAKRDAEKAAEQAAGIDSGDGGIATEEMEKKEAVAMMVSGANAARK